MAKTATARKPVGEAARKPAAEKAQTGRISVKIGAFPGGQIKEYVLPAGSTIADGLRAASLRPENRDVRVNGRTASSLDTPLASNDQVLVFSQVRGN